MATFHSAEVVKTEEGRQYHIGLTSQEVAPNILLCGDPARAERVSQLFDSVSHRVANREYLTFTGKYQGLPLSVMATGIGCDNTEIAMIELLQITENPVLIRIGSSGALAPEIELGELVISTGAVRLENTSLSYVMEGYPAVAHYEVLMALIQASEELNKQYHVGLTATASGFYGAQGRTVPGFPPPREPKLLEHLEQVGVKNLEMETSTLFTLAQLKKGTRAGCVCAIYANRHKNKFIDTETKSLAEMSCIQAGLKAMTILAQLDAQKKNKAFWHPGLGAESKNKASKKK